MHRILIIDDDPDVRTVMQLLLKKHGYDVQTASRREEALEKLEAFHPSVILLDVLLSGYDGRELCKEIKLKDKMQEVSVIMISAHPGAAENFDRYGANDFITKPVNTDSLLKKLQHIVTTG